MSVLSTQYPAAANDSWMGSGRPMGFEVGVQETPSANFRPVLSLVLPINPDSCTTVRINANALQLTRPGYHYEYRAGEIASRVQISGHTRWNIKVTNNGRRVSGESAMRGLLDLFDCYNGAGEFQGPEPGTATLRGTGEGAAEVVPLSTLRMRWYNFEEPRGLDLPAQGFYDIFPEPIQYLRTKDTILHRYTLTFTCLQRLDYAQAAEFAAATMIERNKQLALAKAEFVSTTMWAFAGFMAYSALDLALRTAEMRRYAEESFTGWTGVGTEGVDLPASMPDIGGYLADMARWGASL